MVNVESTGRELKKRFKKAAEEFLDKYPVPEGKIPTFRGVPLTDFSKDHLIKLCNFLHRENSVRSSDIFDGL